MDFTYTVIFEPAQEGGYLARIPALDTVTEGESLEEARQMARDLIQSRLEALLKLGRPIPTETEPIAGGEQLTANLAVYVT